MDRTIYVSLVDNGDVMLECPECDMRLCIPIELSESPFWEMYNGEALLVMLAHLAVHKPLERCRHNWITMDEMKRSAIALKLFGPRQKERSFHWCFKPIDHKDNHVCAVCRRKTEWESPETVDTTAES